MLTAKGSSAISALIKGTNSEFVLYKFQLMKLKVTIEIDDESLKSFQIDLDTFKARVEGYVFSNGGNLLWGNQEAE
mgnify:CR=1 FL=1